MRTITVKRNEVEGILCMIPKSAIFSVVFNKRDGSFRTMNCRRGVYKYTIENPSRTKKANPENIVTVFEMSKKQYRSFDVERVKEIRAARKCFVVED
jgi:hypothetical protein